MGKVDRTDAREAAFARRPEDYQGVIVEGLLHRDVAARLGITEANARMLLARPPARLAKLQAHGGADS